MNRSHVIVLIGDWNQDDLDLSNSWWQHETFVV
jgi:hypothetical protein